MVTVWNQGNKCYSVSLQIICKLIVMCTKLQCHLRESLRTLTYIGAMKNTSHSRASVCYKKLSYRRVTARCVLSVVILPIATQQCRNYLYDKSWPNWWYEVGGLVGGNVSWTMCTQPWRDRVGSHCLRCHKQTDDGRIVYITSIPTTCCGEIF